MNRLTFSGKLIVTIIIGTLLLLIYSVTGWRCTLFISVVGIVYFYFEDWNHRMKNKNDTDEYSSKHEMLQKRIDETVSRLDYYQRRLAANTNADPQIVANFISRIQHFKDELSKLNPNINMSFVVQKRDEAGNILVVQDVESLNFFGIGDTITHYHNEKALIVNIKETSTKGKFLYNYYPLNEDLGLEQREQWKKHDAAFSNITHVSNSENTIATSEKWWELENKRRDDLPRFMVKIMYPKSIYHIGQIIECFDKNFQLNKETLAFCEEYPEIFEKVSSSLGDITKTFGILEFSEKVA